MDLKAKFVKIEVLEIGKELDGLLIDFSKFPLGNHWKKKYVRFNLVERLLWFSTKRKWKEIAGAKKLY